MATPHCIYLPKIRSGQSVIKAGRDVFAWGGLHHGDTYNDCVDSKKLEVTNHIDVYDHFTNKWRNLSIYGQGPLGIHKYACSSLNENRIYYFGGYCGHDQCYHNSLYELDISDFDNLTWTEILPTEETSIIKRKIECGLFCFTANNKEYALIVGGKVYDDGTPLTSFETRNPRKGGTVFTRECHIVDLMTGEIVLTQEGPLSADFQFVGIKASIDDHTPRAIAYGGNYSDGLHKDIHIAEIEANIDNKLQLKWTTVYARRNSVNVWPRRRHHYAVCALQAWQSLLLLSGCDKKDGKCLRECWIYSFKNRQWTNVGFPDQLTERMGHSIVAWAVTPNCMRVAVIGGTSSNGDLVHQQFSAFEIYLVNKEKREVSDVINLNTANEYLLQLSGVEHLKGLIKEIKSNWEKQQIELEFERDELEKDREELKAEKTVLEKSKEEFLKDRAILRDVEIELEHDREEYEHEIEILEREKQEVEHKEEELEHFREELEHEKEELEKEKHEIEHKEEELQHEKEELEHVKEELTKELFQFECTELELENEQKEIEHEKEEIEHEKEEIEHVKEYLEKEKHEVEHKEEELKHIQEELEHEKEELEKEKHEIEHKEELLHERDMNLEEGKPDNNYNEKFQIVPNSLQNEKEEEELTEVTEDDLEENDTDTLYDLNILMNITKNSTMQLQNNSIEVEITNITEVDKGLYTREGEEGGEGEGEGEERRELEEGSESQIQEERRQAYVHELETKIEELTRDKKQTEAALRLQQSTLKKERQKIVQNNENTKELIGMLKDKVQQKSEEIEAMKGTFLQNNKALRDLMQKFQIPTTSDH